MAGQPPRVGPRSRTYRSELKLEANVFKLNLALDDLKPMP
ncbi:MAG: hypothetical protein QOF01_5198 [Thermomicrobiales bacterium]|jgi:hypothetical protein|nr:hypothetical protein [Thermomicrobiales bacterium]MEA2598729.1 hypothetical protein [Thermomicrobiales bacterium]